MFEYISKITKKSEGKYKFIDIAYTQFIRVIYFNEKIIYTKESLPFLDLQKVEVKKVLTKACHNLYHTSF